MADDMEKTRLAGIAKHDAVGDFVTDVDGFVYFWPRRGCGHFAAHHLRWIADELDRRNAPMVAELDRYFAEQDRTAPREESGL